MEPTDENVAATISIDEEEKPETSPTEDIEETIVNEETALATDSPTNVAEQDIPSVTVEAEEPPANAQKSVASRRATRPKDLVVQGVSFLSDLAETLKSPEATAQLVDTLVEKDEKTGETSIKIPVESKEVVSNLLTLVGKLFAK